MTSTTHQDQLPRIDYRDHFNMTTEQVEFESIDDFLPDLILRQPRWLTMVSMGVRDRSALKAAVAESTFTAGSAVGNWRVFERGDSWAVLGEDLSFLRYRMLYEWTDERTVEASTTVMYPSFWGDSIGGSPSGDTKDSSR